MDVHVMMSRGLTPAYEILAPEFERTTGIKVVTVYGPSIGSSPEAIPNRMARGEPVDVIIMAGSELANLIKQGKVVADSRVDLARSPIAVAVRAGAPKPSIGSAEALKRTLLAATSIAYSDGVSGVYVSTELFARLGIADEAKGKSRMISAPDTVTAAVARGEAEIGFQQLSELINVPGIETVGSLPCELDMVSIYSAGIAAVANEPKAGKALVEFLASPSAWPVVTKTGMEPVKPEDQAKR